MRADHDPLQALTARTRTGSNTHTAEAVAVDHFVNMPLPISGPHPVWCSPRRPIMTFLFAYLGSLSTPPGWPIQLMHVAEAAFVTVAMICIVLIAVISRGRRAQPWGSALAVVGGVSTSFGLIMPFELAPFFFGARGEWMLATIALNLIYPVAALLFVFGFHKLMSVLRGGPVPPPLP
jgi:thiosulfate dehydrogenase (quinone) large subunit